VRSMVCRGIHLLSVTMVPLPLSTLMPYTVLTNHHRTIHTLMLTVQGEKATETPLIGTPTLNLRMPYSYLGSSTEPPTLHDHHLYSTTTTYTTQIRLGESHGVIHSNSNQD